MGVRVVRVVHSRMVAIVLQRSFGDVNFRFTNIPGTRGLKLASVIQLRDSGDPIVGTAALIAADHRGVSQALCKSHLPLVAHLRGLGVPQDFGAFQSAVARKACGSRAGDGIRLLI